MSQVARQIFYILAVVSRSAKDDQHAAAYAAHMREILEAEGLQVSLKGGLSVRV